MMFFAAALTCIASVVGIGINLWQHDMYNALDAFWIAFWSAAYASLDLEKK